jgi:hypothetical protein
MIQVTCVTKLVSVIASALAIHVAYSVHPERNDTTSKGAALTAPFFVRIVKIPDSCMGQLTLAKTGD